MAAPKLQFVAVSMERPVRISGKLRDEPVLNEVSFSLAAGEILCLLGPSGAGKSTVLRLANRLEEPTGGRILLDGQDIASLDVRELRRRVGMVFQVPALLEGTVADNIAFGPRLRQQECDIARHARMVGLGDELLGRPATELSVGQQQRVGVARALANGPEVLLMDEPTSALDVAAARDILELVGELHRDLGLTVVIVTHVLEHARAVADHVVLLVHGSVVEDGPAAEFFAAPRTEMGRRYLAGELREDSEASHVLHRGDHDG